MRVVLQRVTSASVRVDQSIVGAIDSGFVALVGIADGDTPAHVDVMAAKVAGLRVFDDADGKFNFAVADVSGSVLVISQFTLIAELRRGRRPSFNAAAAPEIAEPLVQRFADQLQAAEIPVASGQFGAHMLVDIVNDGPVTIVIDSADLEKPRRSS
jgi:D-tyrosyl-tRNA(Tyr) deacylase